MARVRADTALTELECGGKEALAGASSPPSVLASRDDFTSLVRFAPLTTPEQVNEQG